MIKKIKVICLSALCCLLCFGMFNVKTSAEQLIESIYCHTEIAGTRKTFSSYARPYSVSQGTYKVESTGNYSTSFGTTSKTYVASGTSGAYITNQGLPSGGLSWVSVTSYYYLNNSPKHYHVVS